MPVLRTPTEPPRDMDHAWCDLTLQSRYDRPAFAGETFEPERDQKRLENLLKRVERLMSDGEWRTLQMISAACRGTEASCSARLRDLKRGGYQLLKRRVGDRTSGLWTYAIGRPVEAVSETE
jgi:hypothetical protein